MRVVIGGHRFQLRPSHDAAMVLYAFLGGMVEQGQSDCGLDTIPEDFNNALHLFSLLARFNTRDPGAMRWRTAVKETRDLPEADGEGMPKFLQ